jgi:hypothetical protein
MSVGLKGIMPPPVEYFIRPIQLNQQHEEKKMYFFKDGTT